ncbi:uncharacterized protein LOC132192797 isoform X2 [Neocloeon triangulifer]|nr:uncharacterized protein LOC132192797 isoform X2 [Neocloeon triangulifer]
MLLYPELVLDKGTLPDDSKLPWYLVLRGLMVFLPTLSNAEKSSMIDRITGQCIKSIGLEKKLEASLMMAKGDDFRSFNFEMMHTLHADNPENVILSARNLPKCSLAAASSLFKVLEMSFQVSGLQVLEKARNNLAAALPFLLDCGERHLDCFKVFVTAYFRVSTAAQYAMARNIEMVMPAKDAAEIIEELRRNPNAIHSANHPVAWRLLNAMKTVSVMQCPLTPSAATP